jgi:ketosteroid isomerase-like protein
MSEENVEIVSGVIAAYLAGDYESALSAYHPDAEFDATVRPDGRVFQGPEGVAEGMRVWAGTWDAYRMEVEEIIDAGDRVLVVARESGRGKGSGLSIDQQSFSVFTLRHGKIARWEVFVVRDEALKAAGLSE